MNASEKHETKVRYIRTWREWRPECKCGWTGSYTEYEEVAHDEALKHLRNKEN